MPHAYAANETNPWTIYWIHLIGDHVEDYANALDISPVASRNQPVTPLPFIAKKIIP